MSQFEITLLKQNFLIKLTDKSDLIVFSDEETGYDYNDCSLINCQYFMHNIKEDLEHFRNNPNENALFSDLFTDEPSEDFYIILFNDNSHKVISEKDSDYLISILDDLTKFNVKNICRIAIESNSSKNI